VPNPELTAAVIISEKNTTFLYYKPRRYTISRE